MLDEIKKYLISRQVMVPPKPCIAFKLYLSADKKCIGSALTQEKEGKDQVIFYLSWKLLDAEIRYSKFEGYVAAFIFHALSSGIICRFDVGRYILTTPMLKG